ncbi:MAG: PmoA family protein, partial [Calditrichaceae bacterium]
LFASFSPARDRDWLLEPNKSYTMKYRFVVYNGHLNYEQAEQFWKYYSQPPELTITKRKN